MEPIGLDPYDMKPDPKWGEKLKKELKEVNATIKQLTREIRELRKSCDDETQLQQLKQLIQQRKKQIGMAVVTRAKLRILSPAVANPATPEKTVE